MNVTVLRRAVVFAAILCAAFGSASFAGEDECDPILDAVLANLPNKPYPRAGARSPSKATRQLASEVFGGDGPPPASILDKLAQIRPARERDIILEELRAAGLSARENVRLVAVFGMTREAATRAHQLAKIKNARTRDWVFFRFQQIRLQNQHATKPLTAAELSTKYEVATRESPPKDWSDHDRAEAQAIDLTISDTGQTEGRMQYHRQRIEHTLEQAKSDQARFEAQVRDELKKLSPEDAKAFEHEFEFLRERLVAWDFAKRFWGDALDGKPGIQAMDSILGKFRENFLSALDAKIRGKTFEALGPTFSSFYEFSPSPPHPRGTRRAQGTLRTPLLTEPLVYLTEAGQGDLAARALPGLIRLAKEGQFDLVVLLVNEAARMREAHLKGDEVAERASKADFEKALQRITAGDSRDEIKEYFFVKEFFSPELRLPENLSGLQSTVTELENGPEVFERDAAKELNGLAPEVAASFQREFQFLKDRWQIMLMQVEHHLPGEFHEEEKLTMQYQNYVFWRADFLQALRATVHGQSYARIYRDGNREFTEYSGPHHGQVPLGTRRRDGNWSEMVAEAAYYLKASGAHQMSAEARTALSDLAREERVHLLLRIVNETASLRALHAGGVDERFFKLREALDKAIQAILEEKSDEEVEKLLPSQKT